MTIHFSLNYNTVWGEQVVLRRGRKFFGMDYAGDGVWETTLTGREIHAGQEYTYEIHRDGVPVRKEWRGRRLLLPKVAKEVFVRDRWTDRPADSAFWSSAFTDVIFKRGEAGPSGREIKPRGGNVLIRVAAASIRPDQGLAITGSSPSLGMWKKFIPLDDSNFPFWETAVEADSPFDYKYVLIDRAGGEPELWEEGSNRFSGEIPPEGSGLVLNDAAPAFKTAPWRGAGTAIPVFSIRTRDSFGVGEFHDIRLMVDWAVATGQNLIQLLPVNDTTMTRTWQDSYPYNAVSSFALHPQFIHLPAAGVRRDKAYREAQVLLNSLQKVDYERVNAEKTKRLEKVFSSKKAEILASVPYREFVETNRFWLLPYAVFCCLRDETGTVDFSKWGKFARYTPARARQYAEAHSDRVAFWCWIQYCLHVQLRDAVEYAHAHHVAIKGDLPIGVSRTSADAWMSPELFNLDMQAGAPPDAFSVDGQNWGFPTYNWDRMAETGFAWWKARLRKMSEYFDAYRIDHILGFFRIWEIPARYKSGLMGHFSPALPFSEAELREKGFDVSGGRYVTPPSDDETDVLFIEDPVKKGFWHPRISASNTRSFALLDNWQKDSYMALYNDFFYHRHNAFWRESAMRKLPSLLRSTGMLSCGEDLGMIPDCVPSVMDELNILSLEIQRMPKDPKQDFGEPEKYPYYCVCATGTHDTSTLRAWWEEDRDLTRKFFERLPECSGDAPWFCEPWIVEIIIRQHLESPAMLAVLPLQDYLSVDADARYQGDPADERINVPAIPRHYWRYRMHKCVEELLEDKSLCDHIRTLVKRSGRG